MGRVAVVTGGGSRMGLAVGRRLDPPNGVPALLQLLYSLAMVSFAVEIGWWQPYRLETVSVSFGLKDEPVL
jgi:hypothetical protein